MKVVKRRSDTLAEAQFAITQFSVWVTNADTKAGLMATATTILGGALVSQRTAIRATFSPGSPFEWGLAVVLVWTLLAVLTTAFALTAALRPRVVNQGHSRFSWPTVAATPVHVLDAADPRNSSREAWRAAHELAGIAQLKFRWLRVALLAWANGATGLFAWFLLSP
ncbi:MAG: Pycsar system effector family protein [Umezawaea sp.]